jgi:hypothetical protein
MGLWMGLIEPECGGAGGDRPADCLPSDPTSSTRMVDAQE